MEPIKWIGLFIHNHSPCTKERNAEILLTFITLYATHLLYKKFILPL